MTVLTDNAKQLIHIITAENELQIQRAKGGFIAQDKVLPCLYERLHRLSLNNPSLKKFLDDPGFIHHHEDEGQEFEWAADPRTSDDIAA
jgi:hypothetical protein